MKNVQSRQKLFLLDFHKLLAESLCIPKDVIHLTIFKPFFPVLYQLHRAQKRLCAQDLGSLILYTHRVEFPSPSGQTHKGVAIVSTRALSNLPLPCGPPFTQTISIHLYLLCLDSIPPWEGKCKLLTLGHILPEREGDVEIVELL